MGEQKGCEAWNCVLQRSDCVVMCRLRQEIRAVRRICVRAQMMGDEEIV